MKGLFSAAVVAFTVLGLCLFPVMEAGAADEPALLSAGDAAPDFSMVDMDGNPFTLKEELAKGPVFLVFWSIF